MDSMETSLTILNQIVEKQQRKIGRQQIQNKVLQWAIRWKMSMPANMIDDLITTLQREVDNDAN